MLFVECISSMPYNLKVAFFFLPFTSFFHTVFLFTFSHSESCLLTYAKFNLLSYTLDRFHYAALSLGRKIMHCDEIRENF